MAAKTPKKGDFALGVAPFVFSDLFDCDGLQRLFCAFAAHLQKERPDIFLAWQSWRQGQELPKAGESQLLIDVAQIWGDFVAVLFDIAAQSTALLRQTDEHNVVFAFKNAFINKRVRRRLPPGPAQKPVSTEVQQALATYFGRAGDPELIAARVALGVLRIYNVADQRPKAELAQLEEAARELGDALGEKIAPDALLPRATQVLVGLEAYHRGRLTEVAWPSYQAPRPIDPSHADLVPHIRDDASLPERLRGRPEDQQLRDGFNLSDPRMQTRDALNEIDYCLLCHPRGKDACRHGLKEKDGRIKVSPLGIELGGCPLDERISEAHALRRHGHAIAALAMVTLDNPMCPGTGHRICNDCMKSCIFQKQQPVNVPEAETHILTEVLNLPFGSEIYGLLTRINPLDRTTPTPKPYNGHDVLVVGLGPAGYTLSHYLLRQGFGVTAIDGLKLEPMPEALVGDEETTPVAVRDFKALNDPLEARIARGFGGVAEYGITVRWDKNFLKLIDLTLHRWPHFVSHGGVRFGGTLTLEDAWRLGFCHVALCAGAGRPTIVPMKNALSRGMRAASDFLMGLQLSGAFRKDALANLQVELPAVVIGGGLTAVDTATELLAYYPVQVQKVASWTQAVGLNKVKAVLDQEEQLILARMLNHAQAIEEEKARPDGDVPELLRSWGGVSVAYRKTLGASPAYRLNHEEVHKALQQGISFIENITPTEATCDAYGHVDSVIFKKRDGQSLKLPARSVMMAAGTTPNTIYAREVPQSFILDKAHRFLLGHDVIEQPHAAATLKAVEMPQLNHGFMTSYEGPNKERVSFYGDNHPAYAGNVVRAMASAKAGHRHVTALFKTALESLDMAQDAQNFRRAAFLQRRQSLKAALQAVVLRVNRLAPNIVELVVRAPMQAQKFSPGQFFRLQNYEADAHKRGEPAMEGLALTGAWVDAKRGEMGLITLEAGVSSRLCGHLRPQELVALMGPTGAPTVIPHNETVVLVGGGLGNAVLFSVGKAMRARGNTVIYFAGYKKADDIFMQNEVEAASDQVIWSVDIGPMPKHMRPQDAAFSGNVVQAMQAFAEGAIANAQVTFGQVDRILAIGSDRMMSAVSKARKLELKKHLKHGHKALASINSPMQCMLKEVCAQCLQRHVDPETGAESFVFSCYDQDQEQDRMDWNHLSARLRQNTVLEKLTNLYFSQTRSARCKPLQSAS